MEKIIHLFHSSISENFGLNFYAIIAIVAFLLLGIICRLIFGKKSALTHAFSATISVVVVYIFTIVVYSFCIELAFLISPLPFIGISDDTLSIISFQNISYPTMCTQILSAIVLSFLINTANCWLPKGKNVLSWLFFRCASILLAMIMHLIVNGILSAFFPEGLLPWASSILLGILVTLLAVGILKVVIGTILSLTVHPIIGILYTFFFANIIGKQLSKAVFTSVFLIAIVYLLNHLNVTTFLITSSALLTCIPVLVTLLIVWYFIDKLQ